MIPDPTVPAALIPELAAAIERREPVVLATVVRTDRSVPRRPGSKMLIYSDGRTSGTIGGGEMEYRVGMAAADALVERLPCVVSYSLVDPSSGDPGVCGGEAEIYLEPYMPTPTLLVVGAGHVGRAVTDLAKWLGFHTVVWDDRAEMVDDSRSADVAVAGPIADALASHPIGADDAVVMLTRNVKLDLEILPLMLATPARYVGLIGSSRRWETTRAGLLAAGLSEEDLARVHAPIGLEINAETPEEIAVSVLAEVIGDRRGP